MLPLVSVVMPAYNCAAFVAEAIESALAQDYPNLEILVVNDGSTDDTASVLSRFADRIHVIDVPNGGPARARNTGLEQARGDYIAFLDADDVWIPGKLAAQVEHLQSHPEVGVCYTGWHVWLSDEHGGFVRPAWAAQSLQSPAIDAARSGWIYGRLLFDCELLTTTVMIRASIARETGLFDTALAVGEDYDYWLRLSQARQITRLDCIGALYRVLANSASRTARKVNFEYEVVRTAVNRFGLANPDGSRVDPQALEKRFDRMVLQHGHLHLKQGDPSIAMLAFASGLNRRPWRPSLWLHWLRAFAKHAARPGTGAPAVR
jgi:glycosyltransferase involved in cell wall biosynthesis